MSQAVLWRSASVAVLTLTTMLAATPAMAQSAAELQAQVDALREALARVEGQLETLQEREPAPDVLPAPQRVAGPRAPAPTPAEGFRVGDTVVKFGGIIDLDAHLTSTSDGEISGGSIARDFYIPSATPVGGEGEDNPDLDLTAEASRFTLSTRSERGDTVISSHLELDFLGSGQGNELVTNSFSSRLRRAYFKVGDHWLFGQEWSTFQNLSVIPESASFLALSDGMVFMRQPQIRYTRGPWQFALENSNTRDLVDNQSNVADDGFLPDVVAKYTASGDWGNTSIAGLGRVLVDERPEFGGGTAEETAFGWGVSVAGDVKVSERWGVKYSGTVGEGVGRYIGLAAIAGARVDEDNELEAIPVAGGLVALYGDVAPATRFTFGYSGLFADSKPGETESVQSMLAVLARDIAPRTTISGEVLYGLRQVDSNTLGDDEGDIMRFTVSAKYAF